MATKRASSQRKKSASATGAAQKRGAKPASAAKTARKKSASAPATGASKRTPGRAAKSATKKSPAKKGAAKKGAAKKGAAKKASGAKRRYGAKSQEKVGGALHEMKRGQLKSGGSGKKVKNPKQAIAIGLSEARRAGAKVPPPKRKGARKKS